MALDIEINNRFTIRHAKRITRTLLGDSESPLIKLRCPSCGVFAEMDDDQYRGRVSVECSTPGCAFHETHNFALLERQALCKDDPGGPYVEGYEIGGANAAHEPTRKAWAKPFNPLKIMSGIPNHESQGHDSALALGAGSPSCANTLDVLACRNKSADVKTKLMKIAAQYRIEEEGFLSPGGYVKIFQGKPVGWALVPEAYKYEPGLYLVPEAGDILVTAGGDATNGAKTLEVVP